QGQGDFSLLKSLSNEKARLGKERRKVEELQRQHAESQTHLETQPESMRERMQSQLQQVGAGDSPNWKMCREGQQK
uniref:Uncharacterized protein n=1 Tax=Gopherus agassizii TaxID=38772 RepID=A0A452HKG7_9SAUR